MTRWWLNLRVLYWHLQIGPDKPWVAVRFNSYWWENGLRWKFVGLY